MIHPVDYEPSQDFGDNPTRNLPPTHPIIQTFGNYQPDGHTGIDYPCPIGTQVKAAASGTVVHVGFMRGTYADNPWWIAPSFAGYVYVVDHGHFIGIYGHCKDGSNWVNVGDRVAEGQTLGLSGNTGASTGPHLHFECLPDGYVLSSHMYGRINPHSLFIGSVTYASEHISPLEEEDMPLTKEDVDNIAARIVEVIQPIEDVTRQYLADRTRDAAIAVLNGSQAQEDVTRQYLVDTTQAQSDVTRQFLSDRIKETAPADLAAQIDAAGAAAAVRDELVKLLEGK